MCVRVEYANKAADGTVAAIGGDGGPGNEWGVTVARAIELIEKREFAFFVEQPTNDRVLVVVAERSGKKYLKTSADGDEPNNLLALPSRDPVIDDRVPFFPQSLPGARTPVLREVLRSGAPPTPVPAASRMGGAFPVLPGNAWVRFTAPWPAELEVKLDGVTLERATSGTSRRPDLDALDLGWFHVNNLTDIDRLATTWEIVVVPPPSKRRGPRYTIGIAHLTMNPHCRLRPTDVDPRLRAEFTGHEKSTPLMLRIERGGPRRNLNSLSAADRQTLVDAINQFLTDSVIASHAQITHTGSHLILGHRAYVEELERFLRDGGNGRFVPLPKWDPAETIPVEFRRVRPNDNGSTDDRPPLRDFSPNLPLPAAFRRPNLCTIASLDELGNSINGWHGDVHLSVGGTMADGRVSPAAPIFWCWHAFIDDVALDWETCPN